MRIISKYHDYYDSAMGMGIDKTITYVRETKELKDKDADTVMDGFLPVRISHGGGNYHVASGVVLFCGKKYKFLLLCMDTNGYVTPKPVFAYSANEVRNFVHKNKLEYEKQYRRYKGYQETRLDFTVDDVDLFFADSGKEVGADIFHKYRTPVIAAIPGVYPRSYDTTYHINPRLLSVGFFVVKDAFSAFQDISMFLSGVLGVNARELVAISDKDMRDKKGFDDTSFKTLSPGKKFNRRNRG